MNIASITQSKTGPWRLQWASVGFACTACILHSGKWHVDFPLGNQPCSTMCSLGGAVNQGAQLCPGQGGGGGGCDPRSANQTLA